MISAFFFLEKKQNLVGIITPPNGALQEPLKADSSFPKKCL